MQQQEQEVKSKSETVGVAKYPKYDNVEEAIDKMGEGSILTLINAQVRTNAMNDVRNKVVGRPSKKKLFRRARAEISIEEFSGVQGNMDAIEALVDQKVQMLIEAGETE